MFDQDFLQRKLDHYNKWLLDPKRASGTVYPGFPEEVKLAKGRAKLQAEYAAKAEAKKTKVVKAKTPVKAKRARKAGEPTKQDRAVAIFTRIGGDKAAVVSAIQSELGMSLAGATTYYYNAKKLAA